jgi:replicative DNA helicase
VGAGHVSDRAFEPPPEPDGPPLPPHDAAAERIVLGAVMTSAGQAADEVGDLRAPDFYWPVHGALWSLLARLLSERKPCDPVAVLAALRAEPIRGLDGPYLHTLIAAPPMSVQVGHYAEIIRARATARAVIQAGQRCVQMGYAAAEERELTDVCDQARKLIDDATVRGSEADDEPFGAGLDRTIEALAEPPDVMPTPWATLDEIMGGWAPGRMYAIGARPTLGKSVLLLQAGAYAARLGHPAVIFSLEMSRREMEQRLLADIANVPYPRIMAHALTDADMSKIVQAQAVMYDWPLRIIDTPLQGVANMRQILRQLSRRRPVEWVGLDYLQLMQSPAGSKANRQEVVADISRSLKLLAREFECPVVVPSQLNRGPESRADKMPSLGDLRESGAIEQDCDVVLLLHREPDAPDVMDQEKLTVLIAKNRFGATGNVRLRFIGWHQRAVTA